MENITKKLIIFLAVTILPNINIIRRWMYGAFSCSTSLIAMYFGFGRDCNPLIVVLVIMPILLINLIILTASFSNVGITELMKELNNEENSNLNN